MVSRMKKDARNKVKRHALFHCLLPIAFCLLLCACLLLSATLVVAQSATASMTIDARKVEGQISPMLYGQFAEFMFEDIKGGLYAELIRDRSFEEAPNVIGLPRLWERYPDDRNDDYALNFRWDDSISYPVAKKSEKGAAEHSLRIDLSEGVIPRHGIYQSRLPVRQGIEYRGYLWLKTAGFTGRVAVALEADITDGETYAESSITTSSMVCGRSTSLR